MKKQIDRPLLSYGLTEIDYHIEAGSKQGDTNATNNIINIVRKVQDMHKETCALSIQINWKLS